jgi:hypothetical protein
MPGEPLWKPLLADPRWPKFSAAYRYYTNTKEDYKHVFAATLGKTFSLYRTGFGESMFTEVGVQAAVFPIFDLDTQVLEHINADYLFAIPVTVQFTGISFMGRFSHVSTHLGDQYIRDHPQVKPIHISYEMIDALASFEPNQWFRLYGGGGYIFSPDPSRYGNWQYQGGIELRVISDYVNTNVPTLYVALDVKGLEGSDYTPSTTATIGVEVLDLGKIYFELHDNYTPDGQFYDQKVTWIALGVQLY